MFITISASGFRLGSRVFISRKTGSWRYCQFRKIFPVSRYQYVKGSLACSLHDTGQGTMCMCVHMHVCLYAFRAYLHSYMYGMVWYGMVWHGMVWYVCVDAWMDGWMDGWMLSSHRCACTNFSLSLSRSLSLSIYIYATPPLMYPRFVLELCGMVVVSLQTFPISTILRHMQRTLKY